LGLTIFSLGGTPPHHTPPGAEKRKKEREAIVVKARKQFGKRGMHNMRTEKGLLKKQRVWKRG